MEGITQLPPKETTNLTIQKIPGEFTVCKITRIEEAPLNDDYCFLCKTTDEISLVCKTEKVPDCATEQSHFWRMFRVAGILDFALTGIMARISGPLAEQGISLFAVSTFNTDYVLTKKADFDRALETLKKTGFCISDLCD